MNLDSIQVGGRPWVASEGRGLLRRTGAAIVGLLLVFVVGLVTAAPAEAVSLPVNKWMNLYNLTSGKCADLPGFQAGYQNGPVNQYRCRYTKQEDNQRWRLIPREVVRGQQTYVIQNQADRLCMDLPGTGFVDVGTVISEYPCVKDAGQRFFARPYSGLSGSYKFVHERTGFCLDVAGVRSGYDDARLTLAQCRNNDDHIWIPRTTPSDPRGVVIPRVDVSNIFTTPMTGSDGNSYGVYCARPAAGRDCVGPSSTSLGKDPRSLEIQGKKIPGGVMQFYLWGDYRLIKQQSVDWQGRYCVWHIDFRYDDTDGQQYFYDRGPVHEGCNDVVGHRSITPSYDIEEYSSYPAGSRGRFFKTGRVCAILISGGDERIRSCAFVTP